MTDAILEFTSILLSVIRVFRVNLASYEGQVVSEWRFPNVSLYNLFIEGDYFMAYFVAPVRRAIVNWRAKKGVFIDFADEEVRYEILASERSNPRLRFSRDHSNRSSATRS